MCSFLWDSWGQESRSECNLPSLKSQGLVHNLLFHRPHRCLDSGYLPHLTSLNIKHKALDPLLQLLPDQRMRLGPFHIRPDALLEAGIQSATHFTNDHEPRKKLEGTHSAFAPYTVLSISAQCFLSAKARTLDRMSSSLQCSVPQSV